MFRSIMVALALVAVLAASACNNVTGLDSGKDLDRQTVGGHNRPPVDVGNSPDILDPGPGDGGSGSGDVDPITGDPNAPFGSRHPRVPGQVGSSPDLLDPGPGDGGSGSGDPNGTTLGLNSGRPQRVPQHQTPGDDGAAH